MPAYSKNTWDQLKAITCGEIIKALKKDAWEHDVTRGAAQVYRKGTRRVTMHFQPNKSYRDRKLLNGILDDIGWSEDDLRRLKLIK